MHRDTKKDADTLIGDWFGQPGGGEEGSRVTRVFLSAPFQRSAT